MYIEPLMRTVENFFRGMLEMALLVRRFYDLCSKRVFVLLLLCHNTHWSENQTRLIHRLLIAIEGSSKFWQNHCDLERLKLKTASWTT